MMKEYSMNNLDKVILTDCDGVLLNWEYAFTTWMERHGYVVDPKNPESYDVGDRYGLLKAKKQELVKFFNESSAIGFLPPLRDAMYYVDLLHRKHGYVFHMITSLSLDPFAQELRIKNTKKLFGETAFERFIFCDTGADKDEALEPYRDTGHLWIEDKIENAELGVSLGLESILIEHGHNMHYNKVPLMQTWKEVYDYIVG
jgi:hypothetical protein